jgi:hypothetical protein
VADSQPVPTDRLTRICEAALEAAENHPEFGDDVRAVVVLTTATEGGAAACGYDGDQCAMVTDLLLHHRGLFREHGYLVVQPGLS